MRRGGLWVFSSAWRDKGMMRIVCQNALRVFREIKERACVHCFWLAKPLEMHVDKNQSLLCGRVTAWLGFGLLN